MGGGEGGPDTVSKTPGARQDTDLTSGVTPWSRDNDPIPEVRISRALLIIIDCGNCNNLRIECRITWQISLCGGEIIASGGHNQRTITYSLSHRVTDRDRVGCTEPTEVNN
jgi:hypothetical protein